MYYIYKEEYKEEKDVLNKKDINKFDYAKPRLTNDYLYVYKEDKEQTDKKSVKKNHLKNIQKVMRRNLINWLIMTKLV